jgi:hypothetical protein
MCSIINMITGKPKPAQADPFANVLPPPPSAVFQEKPTHIEASGLKYNAFNFDKISFDIVSRDGFNHRTPDLIVFDQYKYNVQELIAHADEKEITKFMGWALKNEDIKDFKIDFSAGGSAIISGKYKGLLPFSVEMNIRKTEDNKLLFSFDTVKALFKMPDTIRDLLISAMVDLKETPGLLEGLKLKPAFVRFSDNQVLFDPSKISPGVNMPIKFFETTDSGITIHAGTNADNPVSTASKAISGTNPVQPAAIQQKTPETPAPVNNTQNPKIEFLKLK